MPVGLAFSPDGTRIATAQRDRTITIWDGNRYQTVLTLPLHAGDYLSFSADGRRLYALNSYAGIVSYTIESSYSAVADELVGRLSRELELVSDVRLRIEEYPGIDSQIKQAALDILNWKYFAARAAVFNVLDQVLASPGQSSSAVALALRRAQTMLRWTPDNDYARTRLGLAYYRDHAPEEAIQTLDRPDLWKVRGRTPAGDAAVLAMSYHELKQPDKARHYMQIARARLEALQEITETSEAARKGFIQQEVQRVKKLLQEAERVLASGR